MLTIPFVIPPFIYNVLKLNYLLTIITLACICISAHASEKTLQLADAVYEPDIKTVRLYPNTGNRENELAPAVTQLGNWNLRLQFDDLIDHTEYYYVRLIHCNKDWTKSSLMDLDFLPAYNEFAINQSEYSIDTHIPYIHYWFDVPGVKLPGNYVLVAYRGSDKEDIILSKRFMVYDNRVTFERTGNLVGPGAAAQLNQQINFKIKYTNLEVFNPMQDISVTIRQNQRWDNVADKLVPSFVREGSQELEYRFFDPDKMFKGGNEFRFFDLRSLNSPGQNVARVVKEEKPYSVFIFPDKNRHDNAYAQYRDINGNFVIDNFDYRDIAACNYVYVNFTLNASPISGEVYVGGAFNYWNLNEENKMLYDASTSTYQANILLKQGWYDYQYVVKSPDMAANYFEGSHFETENLYELFVYWRPSYQPQADLLVGYVRLDQNSR